MGKWNSVMKNNLVVLIVFLGVNLLAITKAILDYGGMAENGFPLLTFIFGQIFGFFLFNSIKGEITAKTDSKDGGGN